MKLKLKIFTAMLVCLHPFGAALWAAASKGETQGLSLSLVERRWTGDYDEMVTRRRIRVLVVNGRTFHQVRRPRSRAVYYRAGNAFMGVRIAEFKFLIKDQVYQHNDT